MKRSRMGRNLFHACAFLTYLFLYLPIVVLVVFSFNTSKLNVIWHGFTFAWYAKLLEDAQTRDALRNSLLVAAVAVPVSTALGTLSAFAVHRLRFPGRRALEGALYIPIVLPEIIMGISLLELFSALHIKLGLVTIMVAHITFCAPFVFVVVRARLHDLSHTLERAAMDLGADEWLTFWWVTFPLISPGILAGALLAFTLSLDDMIITFFTAGAGATTLPMRIYSMVRFSVTPEINALSTVFLVVTLGMVLTAEWLRRRSA